jgi:hypothetical protein
MVERLTDSLHCSFDSYSFHLFPSVQSQHYGMRGSRSTSSHLQGHFGVDSKKASSSLWDWAQCPEWFVLEWAQHVTNLREAAQTQLKKTSWVFDFFVHPG